LYDNQGGENEGAFSQANLKKFGKTIGLNATDFNTCVDSRIHKVDVETETQGGTQYGVQATPTVFVNGKRFEGAQSYATFKQAIEEALK
jgi:protein-disulfide isomerase